MALETIAEHTVYVAPLNATSVVLDVGANLGRFSHAFLERFGCTCYAVEAVPALAETIPAHRGLSVYAYAIAGACGPIRVYVSRNSEQNTILADRPEAALAPIMVDGVTLEAFTERLGLTGPIDLVKMDIEGAEIPALAACSDAFLQRVRQFTIEIHDFNGMVAPDEVRRLLARFRRLGFLVIPISVTSHLDTLVINRAACDLGPLHAMWLRAVERWRMKIQSKLRHAA